MYNDTHFLDERLLMLLNILLPATGMHQNLQDHCQAEGFTRCGWEGE